MLGCFVSKCTYGACRPYTSLNNTKYLEMLKSELCFVLGGRLFCGRVCTENGGEVREHYVNTWSSYIIGTQGRGHPATPDPRP